LFPWSFVLLLLLSWNLLLLSWLLLLLLLLQNVRSDKYLRTIESQSIQEILWTPCRTCFYCDMETPVIPMKPHN